MLKLAFSEYSSFILVPFNYTHMGICSPDTDMICEISTNLVGHLFGHKNGKQRKEHVQTPLNSISEGAGWKNWKINAAPFGSGRKICPRHPNLCTTRFPWHHRSRSPGQAFKAVHAGSTLEVCYCVFPDLFSLWPSRHCLRND